MSKILFFNYTNPQPEKALRVSEELCEMRKQGRIFTTEDTEGKKRER
jgi:hypothetical protein